MEKRRRKKKLARTHFHRFYINVDIIDQIEEKEIKQSHFHFLFNDGVLEREFSSGSSKVFINDPK